MAHQKWKLLQVTWLPRDTATWTGWSQMESTGGEGQKCEGLSFDSNVPPDPEAVLHCVHHGAQLTSLRSLCAHMVRLTDNKTNPL